MVDKDQLRADASEAEDQVEADQQEIMEHVENCGCPECNPVGEELKIAIKDHQEQFDKQAQEMGEEELVEHMSRLREQSISGDFDKIVKRLEGSTLYGETTDLADLQELVCVAYALGVAGGVKIQADRQKFKYTRGHKKNMH